MALYIVGAGVSSEYLTLKALRAIMLADKVYIDTYTSIAPGVDELLVERLNPTAEIVRATRATLEEKAHRLIEEARTQNIVVLVPGDPHYATTHIAILVEARQRGVEAHLVPGVSGIQAAVDQTGLQVYRFGRIATLVYPEEGLKPYSTLEAVAENYRRNLHSLVLLDLRLDQGKAMTIPEAVNILTSLERELAEAGELEPFLAKTVMVGVARAGLPEAKCVAGPPGVVAAANYPPPPHTLIVTAPRLHPVEEEALRVLCETVADTSEAE